MVVSAYLGEEGRVDVGPREDVDCGRPKENDGFNKLDTSLMMLETGGNKPFPAVELVVVGLGGGGVAVVVVGKRGGTIGRLTKRVSEDNQEGHTNLPSNERTSHRAETRLGEKRKECEAVCHRIWGLVDKREK